MKSYLLSIGCNNYQNLSKLHGAENDAKNIYQCLVNSQYSIYDKDSSILETSPTIDEFRQTLTGILYDNDTPDIFSLFFAGHGGVKDGSYYLCLKDTRLDRMSVTAFSLSEIFRIIVSSGVKHINFIIDACNTGGLINDLMAVMKPDLVGPKGSTGIAILAAAASDEYANETEGQGMLTSNLLKYINGEKRLNSETQYLDIVGIGRELSTSFIEGQLNQTPSSWGINLYGPSIFAKNPFYDLGNIIGTHDFSYIPPRSHLGETLKEHIEEFWDAYDHLESLGDFKNLLFLFQKILEKMKNTDDILSIIRGIGYRFIEKVDARANFIKLEVINVLLSSLLPYAHEEKVIEEINNLVIFFRRYGEISINDLLHQLETNPNYLISNEGHSVEILANYYFLAIRISKILGYASQLILINGISIEKYSTLLEKILEHYSHHLMCMNDNQAPYLYVFFKTCQRHGLIDQSRPFLFTLTQNYLQMKGQVGRLDLEAEKTFSFLLQRYTTENIEHEFLANPGEIGTVLLLFAKTYNLDSDLDNVMHILDRCQFLLFMPKNIHEFSSDIIEDGENLILRCGYDFWTIDEFEKIYMRLFSNYKQDYSVLTKEQEVCCIASSFIQPNRLPIMVI